MVFSGWVCRKHAQSLWVLLVVQPMQRQLLRHARRQKGLLRHGMTAPPAPRERGLQTIHLMLMLRQCLLSEYGLFVVLGDHGGAALLLWRGDRMTLSRSGGVASYLKSSKWLAIGVVARCLRPRTLRSPS